MKHMKDKMTAVEFLLDKYKSQKWFIIFGRF